jgi:hypothetical protein
VFPFHASTFCFQCMMMNSYLNSPDNTFKKFLTTDRIVLLQSCALFLMVFCYCWRHPACGHLSSPESWIILLSVPCSSHVAFHSLWSFCCFGLHFPRCTVISSSVSCGSVTPFAVLYTDLHLEIPHTISVQTHGKLTQAGDELLSPAHFFYWKTEFQNGFCFWTFIPAE